MQQICIGEDFSNLQQDSNIAGIALADLWRIYISIQHFEGKILIWEVL
jgi:hypothetical protein